MKTLKDCISQKSENLNFIKFIAAIIVIYSHSYIVCLGVSNRDIIGRFTNGEMDIGALSVSIFFFTSGLYITKSLFEKKKGKIFFSIRAMRIFPQLFMTILLTTFVIGPIVTHINLYSYFKSIQTYQYLLYMILIPSYQLPGVFMNNPDTKVNISLWTLVLEWICYIGLYFVYKMKLLNQKIVKIVFLLFLFGITLTFIVKLDFLFQFRFYLRPLCLFIVGIFYYLFQDKIKIVLRYGLIAIASLFICMATGYSSVGIIIFLPYILCIIFYSKIQCGKFLCSLGDYSYGMYLIAYPIQQIVVQYNIWGGVKILNNMFVTIIFDILLAIVLFSCESKFSSFYRNRQY